MAKYIKTEEGYSDELDLAYLATIKTVVNNLTSQIADIETELTGATTTADEILETIGGEE